MKFENLHHHTVFSFNDGLGYPEDHAKELKKIDCQAFAVTDHGNMCAFVYQMEACKKHNLKPIYGMEGYFVDSISNWRNLYEEYAKNNKIKKKEKKITPTFMDDEKIIGASSKIYRKAHILLLAKNDEGLSNLFQIITKSNKRENFYMKPRIDFSILRKHREGLICSSACIGGIFADTIHNGIANDLSNNEIIDNMCNYAQKFVDIFGNDFYCELMFNKIPFQHIMNKYVIATARECGIELITTTDVHYPREDLWESRELYRKIGFSYKDEDDDKKLPKRDELQCELYPRNHKTIWDDYIKYSKYADFKYDNEIIERSINNSHYIAHEIIQDIQIDSSYKLPHFVIDRNINENEELRRIAFESLNNKELAKNKEYIDRLNYELDIIQNNNFSSYFLITRKIVLEIGFENMLVGPARGSAGGSLTSYLIGITQIDPLKFDLIFERFMSKNQQGLPDIDVDFADRKGLANILIEKWGENNVVPISNLNTLQVKSLIKIISKFYGIDFFEVNNVTTVIDEETLSLYKEEMGIKAGEVNLRYKDYKKYSKSLQEFLEKYPHVDKHVEILYGSIRSFSKHAGGVLILEDLHKKMPLCRTEDGFQTPWTGGDNVKFLEPMLQKLGFIKFDLLGLNTLELISNTIAKIIGTNDFKEIKQFYFQNLHPDIIDFNDQSVWEYVFQDGNFIGIFQFTQKGVQSFCKEVCPNTIDELSMITSIYRPGPLSADVDKTYVKAKDDPSIVEYEHPIIEEILKRSYGHIVFQEDLAMIAHKMGKNISLDEGNKFRKILIKRGKKGITDDDRDEDIYNRFREGCIEKGLTIEQANKLLEKMEFFSKYGFNKAHATAYSIISYQCAWLLKYYPKQWCAAFLDKETIGAKPDKKEFAIGLVKKIGLSILNADINESDGYSWRIKKTGELIQPLSSIKGLAGSSIEQIINNRPYNNVDDLFYNNKILYSKLNIGKLRTLILSGILDDLLKSDKRFKGLSHLYLSTFGKKGNKPKNIDEFNESIELQKDEREFTKSERIDSIAELTGIFPIEMIVTKEIEDGLNNSSVVPLSEFDPTLHQFAWFICRSYVKKKTKNNKDFIFVKCIDNISSNLNLRIWGINEKIDRLYENCLYVVKIKDHNPRFGYSVSGMRDVRVVR